MESLDRALLARIAVNDADRRSAGCGGRFSRLDVRAGVLRALAASGIITDRADCDELVHDLMQRVLTEHVHDLLNDATAPAHVKSLMASTTVRVKTDLTATLDRISRAGSPLPDAAIPTTTQLDPSQRAAAAAIAGTDRLVSVVGPAGAGKTSMLKSAVAALRRNGRHAVVVAPTRKAAGVAGRETGAEATSLHALLRDHGWIAGEDRAGAVVWRQLRRGDRTPTGSTYGGPTRYPLHRGDRIVVDEAGMVDLHAARALAIVAEQSGAGIAMIGDPRQISPVGHYGALALLRNAATRSVELHDVHRFCIADGQPDTAYAALSLRMREPRNDEDALDVARQLLERAQIVPAESVAAARLIMSDAYLDATAIGSTLSIVVATNDEANAVSELIQRERVALGEISTRHEAEGRDGQRLLVGDVVQSRRNDRDEGVENRQQWRIERIHRDGRLALVSPDDRHRRRTVSAKYAARDVHLAYATTAHGAQGETTDAAIVGPDVDAASFYVGMTRGRINNIYITAEPTLEKAIEEIAAALLRGRGEHTLDENREAAAAELAGAAKEPAHESTASPIEPSEVPLAASMPPLPPDDVIAELAAEFDADVCEPPPADDQIGEWDQAFTQPAARSSALRR